jgi:hypothetical protein
MILAVWCTALLIVAASLISGWALLALLGARRSWLAPAIGLAALTVACPLLIRLPGRAATTAVLVGVALAAALYFLARRGEGSGPEPGGVHVERPGVPHIANTPGRSSQEMAGAGPAPERLVSGRGRMRPRRREPSDGAGPVAAAAIGLTVLALASLPFLFNDEVGVLGEGIYTNDHAAQLYWADWLQNGFGPEPDAVSFGYPTGPQAVAATAAEATGADLIDVFNGLLLAIPVLTALTALVLLDRLPPVRRAFVAALAGLPYLAASFLAQSGFKETEMALLLLASVALLHLVVSEGLPRRAAIAALALLAAASVFTFSVPGLAWLAVLLPAWLVLETVAGRPPIDLGDLREGIARHRVALGAAALVTVAVAAALVIPIANFVDRIADVQSSPGRLSSPVFPGEALGIWPEGDFRLVRGEVEGAIPATAFAAAVTALAGLALLRRRELALAAGLGAGLAVYVGARLFAEIHVEAKALAIAAPLVALVVARFLLAPPEADGAGDGLDADAAREARPAATYLRYAAGALFVCAAAASTLLALRAAPVGFSERGHELEQLAQQAEGESVVFLGVDRFAAYWLRGTLVRSPGGFVPPDVSARREKAWLLGRPLDFDTLEPHRLDDFDYAVTTRAAYQSTPPPNFELVEETDSYALWERTGRTPRTKVLDEGGAPGAVLDCATAEGRALSRRGGSAWVVSDPTVGEPRQWSEPRPFEAPAQATQRLLLAPGSWDLSLQYHSQVPLTVQAAGRRVELPPSLDGMYISHQGESAFWPAGQIEVSAEGGTTVTVSVAEPTDLQDALGLERRVWLGRLAATQSPWDAHHVPLPGACARYVDRYTTRGAPPAVPRGAPPG